ncbi:hypothetical protein BpHYR1_038779 [Brachionus plicatilis]|uniref:Uncharacterized protein n=1 Tax=Brachionus plicatilis TaxID=10195 RepID=A0A3M7SZK2_BRAPC|nr:hypothetical protein BpHYR1_038779 [Brachionus plicatilis]
MLLSKTSLQACLPCGEKNISKSRFLLFFVLYGIYMEFNEFMISHIYGTFKDLDKNQLEINGSNIQTMFYIISVLGISNQKSCNKIIKNTLKNTTA